MKFYLNGKRITLTEAKELLVPVQFEYIEDALAEGCDAICFTVDCGSVDVELNKGEEE